VKARETVTAAEERLAKTQSELDAARTKLEQAEFKLGDAKETALESRRAGLGDARKEVREARARVDELEGDLALAQTNAQVASRTGKNVERLEQEIADRQRTIDMIYQRNRGTKPAKDTPDGDALRLAEGEKAKLQRELQAELATLKQDWIAELRQGTPGPGSKQSAVDNLADLPAELSVGGKPFDFTDANGKLLDKVSPDHIYPFDKIVREPGFNRLTPAQQRELLELKANYLPFTVSANKSKRAFTMEEWFKTDIGSRVPDRLRSALIDAEKRAQKAVRDYIDKALNR
jgi:hypothetical protein